MYERLLCSAGICGIRVAGEIVEVFLCYHQYR